MHPILPLRARRAHGATDGAGGPGNQRRPETTNAGPCIMRWSDRLSPELRRESSPIKGSGNAGFLSFATPRRRPPADSLDRTGHLHQHTRLIPVDVRIRRLAFLNAGDQDGHGLDPLARRLRVRKHLVDLLRVRERDDRSSTNRSSL